MTQVQPAPPRTRRRATSVDREAPTRTSSAIGWWPLLVWSLPAVVALLLIDPFGGRQTAELGRVFAALIALQGLWVFWTHGGRRISAPGAYSAAMLGFGGYAGWWWMDHSSGTQQSTIVQALIVLYAVQVVTYSVFWHSTRHSQVRLLRWKVEDPAVADASRWGTQLGLVLTVVGIVAANGPGFVATAGSTTAYVGLALASAGLAARGAGHIRIYAALLIGALVLAFLTFAFEGYGRLNIVALLLVPAVVYSMFENRRRMKLITILGAPLALVVLNAIRRAAVIEERGDFDESEVGSMESPVQMFAQLLADQGNYAYAHGESIFGSIFILIPRAVWPSKPAGFGTNLTEIYAPELLAVGHTFAGLSVGEFYYNFGVAGLVLCVLVLGLLIRWVDQLGVRFAEGLEPTRASLVKLVIVVLVIAGMPDLAWNGSSTFASRAGFRVVMAVLLLVLFARGTARPPRTGPTRRRVRSSRPRTAGRPRAGTAGPRG